MRGRHMGSSCAEKRGGGPNIIYDQEEKKPRTTIEACSEVKAKLLLSPLKSRKI